MTRSTGIGLLGDTEMSYRPDSVTGVYELGSLVVTLPALVVLVVGLVAVSPRRMPGRGVKLARAGLLVLLGQLVLGLLWSSLLPRVVIRNGYSGGSLTVRGIGFLNAGVGFLLDLVLALGLALLIGGLVSALRARPAAPYPPPSYGAPAGYQPTPASNYPVATRQAPSTPPHGYPPAQRSAPSASPQQPVSATPPWGYPAPDSGSFPPPQAYQPPTGPGSFTPPAPYTPPSSDSPASTAAPTSTGSSSGDVLAGRRQAGSGEHHVPLPDEHTPAEEDSSGHDMDHGADPADGSTHRIVSRAQDPWSHTDGH